MKSPQIIQQLKNYQSLRRNQFLSHSCAARHTEKKSSRTVKRRCSESDGQTLNQKPTDASDEHSTAFSVHSTTSQTARPVMKPDIVAATNTAASDTTDTFGSRIWSKSDSAFTSFTSASNISNSQNAQ